LDIAGLEDRYEGGMRALERCLLCPRACGVNRREGQTGFCGAGMLPRVAAVSVHHGEEPPITGSRGSGTVFFSHCNMRCIFCQNYPISQLGIGEMLSTEELGERLLWLERKGAHNVNFVTPTPHVPQLIGAVLAARKKGFALPVVYNSNGFDSLYALELLEGVVDIFLPDVKTVSPRLAEEVSSTPAYPGHNAAAVSEMVRQVGALSVGEDEIARRGVLIRHLVLPGKVHETEKVLGALRKTHGTQIPLSLMSQYFPAHRAASFPGYERRLSREEYEHSVETALRLGFENVFLQEI